jgi:hypothetical protein
MKRIMALLLQGAVLLSPSCAFGSVDYEALLGNLSIVCARVGIHGEAIISKERVERELEAALKAKVPHLSVKCPSESSFLLVVESSNVEGLPLVYGNVRLDVYRDALIRATKKSMLVSVWTRSYHYIANEALAPQEVLVTVNNLTRDFASA